jgi:hypothetical protein
MQNQTRKYGGDIKKHSIYKDILSIGYEMETGSLAKLVSEEGDNGKTVLLNTDSARDDIRRLISGDFSDVRTDEEESYELRINEAGTLVIDAYDEAGKLDKDILFVVANDITESNFVNYNNAICRALNGRNLEESSKSKSKRNSKSKDKSAVSLGEIEKDDLYKFRLLDISTDSATASGKTSSKNSFTKGNQKEYDIHFVFWGTNVECGVFSDVEWVATYYKPAQKNPNIILDTFANMMRNFMRHLDGFVAIPGNIVITDGTTEFVVKNPETRMLFHKPGTNLNYLQTHFSSRLNKSVLSLDDVCITCQMTFSSHASKVFPIMKTMIKDTILSIENNVEFSRRTLDILLLVEKCVLELIKHYNTNAEKRFRIIQRRTNKHLVSQVKNLLMLFFYKLYIFINIYDRKSEVYFKDFLIFNVRHSNYILYKELKKVLAELFELTTSEIDEETIINIVRSIAIQESVLEHYLIKDSSFIRKRAFHPDNRMEKNSASYGDPTKSLVSYFDFFENPNEKDNHLYDRDNNETGTILFYDWLEYKQYDKFSAKMPLNNGVILIEYRAFSAALATYLYSIKDEWMQEQMTQGPCNVLMNDFTPKVRKLPISLFRRFLELYDAKKNKNKGLNTSKNVKSVKRKTLKKK